MVALIAVIAAAVLADKKRTTVIFDKDVIVNGTLVKAGTYNAQFDFKTDTLSVMKESGKVVATATGTVEDRTHKAAQTEIETDLQGNNQVVTSITFSGDHRTILIGGATKSAGGDR
jgi:hypothetical protein